MEVTNVFTQLKIKLDQEISEKRNVQVLQKYYMESLPLLQVNFCGSLALLKHCSKPGYTLQGLSQNNPTPGGQDDLIC